MSKILKPGKLPNQLLKNLLGQLPKSNSDIMIPPGIGLDAAGLRIEGRLFAVTTDPVTFTSKNIGKYAVRINVNDIACLGCQPLWFSSVILLPEGTSESYLQEVWNHLSEELNAYDIETVGGHCEVTPAVNEPVVIGQLIGEAVHDYFFDPRQINCGDKILLWRGAAVEGTALLATERFSELSHYISEPQLETMKNLLDEPGICIWPAAKKLFDISGIVALHDPTEGGVATALHELADVAGCGLKINADKIPILSETLQLAEVLPFDPLGLLASGSLIIVCQAEAEQAVLDKLAGERVGQIGEFIEEDERTMQSKGNTMPLPRFDQDEIVKALNAELKG